MISTAPQILFFLEMLIFSSVIFMHLSKKSSTVVNLYMLQLLIIFGFLLSAALEEFSWLLMIMAMITFVIKIIVAPYFFKRLIRKNHIKFSASTYLNGPLTLIVLALITATTYSHFFQPLATIAPANAKAMLLAVAMMLGSIFLIINRKGALSQAIGILSLENSVVSFAFISGLEQAPALQLGIIFDIAVWAIVAATMTAMIYRKIETLDVSTMSHLKEE